MIILLLTHVKRWTDAWSWRWWGAVAVLAMVWLTGGPARTDPESGANRPILVNGTVMTVGETVQSALPADPAGWGAERDEPAFRVGTNRAESGAIREASGEEQVSSRASLPVQVETVAGGTVVANLPASWSSVAARAFLSERGRRWTIDLPGSEVPAAGMAMAGPEGGPLLMLRVGRLRADPPLGRIDCWLAPNCLPKLVWQGDRLQLQFSAPAVVRRRSRSGSRAPHPPLAPPNADQEVNRVTLAVGQVPTDRLIDQLAAMAGIQLRFRDPLPAKTPRLRLEGGSPRRVLASALGRLGLVLTEEADGFWVTRRDSPLLGIPADEPLEMTGGTAPSLRVLLAQALQDPPLEERIRRLLPAKAWGEPVALGPAMMTARSVVAALLSAHGVVWKSGGQEERHG